MKIHRPLVNKLPICRENMHFAHNILDSNLEISSLANQGDNSSLSVGIERLKRRAVFPLQGNVR